jgi:hypothetical protein
MKDATPKTDAEVDAMSDGDFYHHMLWADHREWARQIDRRMKLRLDVDTRDALASWVASIMCAVTDRENAGYIRARLDAEKAEDGGVK